MSPSIATRTYRDGDGTGPVVVLLHGFPLDHRMWDDVAAALPEELAVVAPDLPLLGRSRPPAHDVDGSDAPSLGAAADAVAAIVRGAGGRPVVLAGLSMGGYVAMALLDRHPDLVDGLVLLDTRSTPDDEDARANRRRIAAEVEAANDVAAVLGMAGATLGATSRGSRPGLVARLESWIRDQEPRGIAWSQRAMADRPDRTHVLSAFRGPAAVVVGEEDEITPVSAARHMAEALGGAPVVEIPGAGHMSAVEQPERVAQVLRDVADRAASAG